MFADALRVLRMLWDAQSALPPGRSMRFMCAHLQLHQDELTEVLKALKRMGYVVSTESGAADHWVLSCDQRETTIGPLIDELSLDRPQRGLNTHPELLGSEERRVGKTGGSTVKS